MIDYIARQVPGYGRIVVPTGMVVVRDVSKPQNVAEIIQQYWPIYRGMSVLPADHFTGVGHVRAVPISDGVDATVIAQRSNARLTELQGYMFIDKGKTRWGGPRRHFRNSAPAPFHAERSQRHPRGDRPDPDRAGP